MKKAELIPIYKNIENALVKAIELYQEGRIFAYPTDTIYGLGGNPFNSKVVERIVTIKQRDASKNFIYLVSSLNSLYKYVELPNSNIQHFLTKLIHQPVTLVLNLKKEFSKILSRQDAAFRIPNEQFCLELLSRINQPLISTSVNRAEMNPLNDKNDILMEFGEEIDVIFYSDSATQKKASTIISLKTNEPLLIREGNVSFDEIVKLFKFANETF